eukprot:TRINITY_DN2222_c0_g1_i3.p1 TRINITY_DN2222_c0_g1~~TRINITY_DN2222_c0_g1_i3.p1  ORF type:complete len:314 (+),score=64.31 TRINITY_DN2222_c0_g1_i3:364-1305(+)
MIVVKATFSGLSDIRRFNVVEAPPSWPALVATLREVFGVQDSTDLRTVKYYDDEGDLITMSSQAELETAVAICKSQHTKTTLPYPILRVFVERKGPCCATAPTSPQQQRFGPFACCGSFPPFGHRQRHVRQHSRQSRLNLPFAIPPPIRSLLSDPQLIHKALPLLQALLTYPQEENVPDALIKEFALLVSEKIESECLLSHAQPQQQDAPPPPPALPADPTARLQMVEEHVRQMLRDPCVRQFLPAVLPFALQMVQAGCCKPGSTVFQTLCAICKYKIAGARYKCNVCPDFVVCAICKPNLKHDPTHTFTHLC